MTRKVYAPNEHIRNIDNALYYGIVANQSIRQSAVTVAQTAIKLPTTPLSSRKFITIFNNANNPIFIGDSNVTASDGRPIYPRSEWSAAIEDNIDIYGISSTGSNDIRILEGV